MSKLIISIDPLSQEFKTHISPNKLELSVTFYFQRCLKYFIFITYNENAGNWKKAKVGNKEMDKDRGRKEERQGENKSSSN